jgi:uncharacterized membrane protein YkvA (DUF1232 family)
MSTLDLIIVATAVAIFVVATAGWILWRQTRAEDRRLIKRIVRLPFGSKLALAWAMYRDERVPTGLRFIPPFLVLYLAMPIDIVPDFIPVLGQLDDVVILVVGVGLLFRFVGREVLEEHVAALEDAVSRRREVIES